MEVKAWMTPASERGEITLAKLRPTSWSRFQPKNRSTEVLSQAMPPAWSMSARGKIECSAMASNVSGPGPTAWISSMRLPNGSSVWSRRIPGWSSAGRTSPPAATICWATTSMSSTSRAGWALAAARKSSSTPRCSRSHGPSNQHPAGLAVGGLGTRASPSTPQ